MKIISKCESVIKWQTKGESLSGTSHSKDSRLLLLTPGKSTEEIKFEVDCIIDIHNVNGNYAECIVRSIFHINNNRKTPLKEDLYYFIKEAYKMANVLSIQKQGLSDFFVSFTEPSFNILDAELQKAIDSAYPLGHINNERK